MTNGSSCQLDLLDFHIGLVRYIQAGRPRGMTYIQLSVKFSKVNFPGICCRIERCSCRINIPSALMKDIKKVSEFPFLFSWFFFLIILAT